MSAKLSYDKIYNFEKKKQNRFLSSYKMMMMMMNPLKFPQ